ncbi:MAG: hypothetical protein U0237_17500 [Thermoleophilia bacterium]
MQRGLVTAALGQIFHIAVLRQRGELDEARRALEAVAPRVRATRYLEFWHQVEADLAFDEGGHDRALHLAAEARRLSRSHGYRIGDRALFAVTEGRLLVQMGRARDAEGVLGDASAWCRERGACWASGSGATRWAPPGCLGGRPAEEVAGRLRAAVAGMRRATRHLELPLAAVALAEAEWRRGDEEVHDAACDGRSRGHPGPGVARAAAARDRAVPRRACPAGGRGRGTRRTRGGACSAAAAPGPPRFRTGRPG